MPRFAKIRFLAAIIACSALLQAQTTQTTPHPAQVTYTNGKLFVSADNSSLNQILRDIGRKTGMKITGGVTDERVFGQYGPAVPSSILNTLLDGTGSNMLLLQATATTPAELVLTPRHGGPTPPNPNAFVDEPALPAARPPYPRPMPPEQNGPRHMPEAPSNARTPQQIYEQLQRMRQQQQSNQQ